MQMITLKNALNNLYYKETPNKTEQSSKDQAKSTLEMFREAMEGTNFKSEEEKMAYEAKLNEKIKRGDKLSEREMSYLQRTNPIMYFRVKRVQVQRELLETRLKQCRSKKEVEEAYHQATSMIHSKDPDKQLLVKAYDNVTREFKKTREYQALPNDIKEDRKEEAKRRKEQREAFNSHKTMRKISTFDMSV